MVQAQALCKHKEPYDNIPKRFQAIKLLNLIITAE